jgi:hypothetical protein
MKFDLLIVAVLFADFVGSLYRPRHPSILIVWITWAMESVDHLERDDFSFHFSVCHVERSEPASEVETSLDAKWD